ncbi:class F sortase [Streptomyces palmae]|uniref:class F sortase n=1 Tax=Streptomyces palmae TaxID=1701085 RepID=UPI001FD76380|nr:class F sortase [Streptomyces palmae]
MPRIPGRVLRPLLAAGAALALAAGGWTLYHASEPAPRVDARPVATAHPPLSASPATALSIPALELEAPVTEVGLDPRGHLATPPVDDARLAGWYRGGPAPGEQGTSVIVGHRDTRNGPAVFLNLDDLDPGDTVKVARADHRTAVFTVDKVRTYTKAHFPDRRVYGSTGRPELRLLTCGGTFDRRRGYAANIVVFAHLVRAEPTVGVV